MKIAVEKNSLYCPDINARIHHMECNDECRHFCGCTIAEKSFVIDCAWAPAVAAQQQTVRELSPEPQREKVASA